MYLHLGQDTVIPQKNIIGIFDMDNTTVSKNTRKYLNEQEKMGLVLNVDGELPKSFTVACDYLDNKKNVSSKKRCFVYISKISSRTLLKRASYFMIG